MAGAVPLSSVGAIYVPYPGEKDPVVIRPMGDNFHVCVRKGPHYEIVADVRDRNLAEKIKALLGL